MRVRLMSMAMVGAVLLFGVAAYAAGSAHLFAPRSLAAADSGCQTFTQTGHTVCGDFLVYWQTNGGLAQQGYPISDVFDEKSETDGITHKVQYFERAVFEAHPENQPPYNVLLSLLGSQKYKTKYPNGMSTSASATAAASPSPSASPSVGGATSGSLTVVRSGFGQVKTEIGYGFVVMNTDPGNEITSSQYQIAAYDASGGVLKTDSGYIEILFPNQQLGIGGMLSLPDGVTAARVDVQVKAGTKKAHDPGAFILSAANLAFRPDKDYPKATGIVKNSYGKDIKEVDVYVLAYDSGNKIIGSGHTYLDFVTANGQAAVEVSMTVNGTPTRLEMYPTVSSLSSIG